VPRRSAIAGGVAALCLLAAGAPRAPAAEAGFKGVDPAFRDGGTGPLVGAPAAASDGNLVQLSNEKTLTQWAYVEQPIEVRTKPEANATVIKRLRTQTHDRTPELVLALEELSAAGTSWVHVRFTTRPNNRTGWVPRSALGPFNTVNTLLEIKRRKFKLTLFQDGKRVMSAPIGVGRGKWPTPSGNFYIRERLIPRQRNSIYGVFAFGTSATSPVLTDWPGGGIIGIHGTNEPGLIPGRISHGCIRVRNARISRLRDLVPLGTPLRIK
jgi:hypothetical protein